MAAMAMDMDDDEDIWANTTTSPSASPPQPAGATACNFISTHLSLNSRLHLLSSAAAHGSRPDHAGGGDGIYAADGHHVGLGGGFRNAAASPASFFPYGLDAGAGRGALEHEMCIGPAGAAAWAGAVGGTDWRKKRMIKNRESAARSRARKQAYVRELEREVKHLQQENQSLRVKYEQLRVSVEVPVPLPVKKTLQRMRSAPF
ncbi:hypothetical protein EJB05_43725, partial [Eragrostis curvula]